MTRPDKKVDFQSKLNLIHSILQVPCSTFNTSSQISLLHKQSLKIALANQDHIYSSKKNSHNLLPEEVNE